MKKTIASGILLVLALAIMTPASASLVGTAFGYPTIVQSGSTTAFNQDYASATDNEAILISFPTTGTVTGISAFSFPTIVQTVDQSQVMTHTDFAQTTEEASFSYPFVSVGDASLASLGFGF
jgi:hypothetical protein